MDGVISNEKILILDLYDDGPSIRLLGQLQNKENNQFIKEKVFQICRASEPLSRLPITQITVGTIAVAQIIVQSSTYYYRIQVIDNRNWNSGRLRVLFIDDCNWKHELLLNSLFAAPQKMLEIPKTSEVFCLADVSPLCYNNWSETCIDALRSQLLNKLVTGTVLRENGKISLFRPYQPNEQGQLLAETMVQCGMAHITPSFPGFSPFPKPNLTHIPEEYIKGSFLPSSEHCIPPVIPQSCSYPMVPVVPYGCLPEKNIPTFCSNNRNMDIVGNMDKMRTSPSNSEDQCRRFISISIKQGFSDKCQVSYIEKGPWKFGIKLFSNHCLEKELKEKMEYICISNLKALSVVEHGICVLCKFNEKFCRGIIVGIEDFFHGSLNIYLVDLGCEEEIPVNFIWRIPFELLEIPILVTRCCLNNIPKHYNSQLAKNFLNVVEKHILKITFGCKTSDLLFNVELFAEEYLVSKMISLELYGREKVKTADEVVLSYASEKLGLFYLQLSKNLPEIQELQNQIMNENWKSNIVHKPFYGLPCLALYSEDSNYYRGIITSANREITISYVDFGNEEIHTDLEKIKVIPSSLLNKIPSQAIPCVLDGVDEDMVNLKDIYENESRTFIVTVVDEVKRCIEGISKAVALVKLYDKVSQKCLNDFLLQKHGFNRERTTKKQSVVHFSEEVSVFPHPSVLEHEAAPGKESGSRLNEVTIVPDWLKICRVTHVQSPSLFFVTLVQNEKTIKIVSEILKKNYGLVSSYHSPFLTVGDEVMITSASEKDCLHRALIVSHLQGDLLKLKLVDVGKEIAVSNFQVRPICPEASFEMYPPQAIKCALENPSFVSESQEKAFEAEVTKESVKIHFIRKQEDKWMVSILKTADILTEISKEKQLESKNYSHHRSRWDMYRSGVIILQCQNAEILELIGK